MDLRGSWPAEGQPRAIPFPPAQRPRHRQVSLLVPFLLLVIATVVTSRYLARGFDNPSFYLLASLGYGFVLVLRPLLSGRGE